MVCVVTHLSTQSSFFSTEFLIHDSGYTRLKTKYSLKSNDLQNNNKPITIHFCEVRDATTQEQAQPSLYWYRYFNFSDYFRPTLWLRNFNDIDGWGHTKTKRYTNHPCAYSHKYIRIGVLI